MSYLTLFTAPKPFTNPHIALIQHNAICSWKRLGTEVDILLLGEEVGLAETTEELDVRYIRDVKRNSYGTPLISSLFELARQSSSSPFLGFVNADILLLPEFVTVTRQIAQQIRDFLIIGQRWDLGVQEALDFSSGWENRLKDRALTEGKIHRPVGSDYFIFPRSCFMEIPDFAIGRSGWDNWMIYQARIKGWHVVDTTTENMIIHQEHDYSHLPDNKPHYRLPESEDNIRMAGGRRSIFKLIDADWKYQSGKLQPATLSWAKFWREVEIFPLLRFHSRFLANLFFAFFHPGRGLWELRQWLSSRLHRKGVTHAQSRD